MDIKAKQNAQLLYCAIMFQIMASSIYFVLIVSSYTATLYCYAPEAEHDSIVLWLTRLI